MNFTDHTEMTLIKTIAEFLNLKTGWVHNNVNFLGNAEVPELVNVVDGAMGMMAVKELYSQCKVQDCCQIVDQYIVTPQ